MQQLFCIKFERGTSPMGTYMRFRSAVSRQLARLYANSTNDTWDAALREAVEKLKERLSKYVDRDFSGAYSACVGVYQGGCRPSRKFVGHLENGVFRVYEITDALLAALDSTTATEALTEQLDAVDTAAADPHTRPALSGLLAWLNKNRCPARDDLAAYIRSHGVAPC